MLVGELLRELGSGRSMKEVAADMEVNPSTIQRRLKKIGYTYSNSSKVWSWAGEGDEPLQDNIFEAQVQSTTTKPVRKVEVATIERRSGDNLTAQEVAQVRELLASFKGGAVAPAVAKAAADDDLPLHDRIKALPREEKIRKNVFLNKGISERLEAFCDQERANKSEIIEVALDELLKRYGS